ncbi:hypothetical protein KAZ92_00540 [Candidatus Gracilibacteria bacterium]|nr:hypothetical protein [Candidatus Gracilibacteria bacterium]
MFHYPHQTLYSASVFEKVHYFGSRSAVDINSWSPWVTEIFLPVIIAGIGLAIQYYIFKSIAYAVTHDGKTVPLAADSDGSQHMRERDIPQAEDNPNRVIAIQHRPLAVSSYSKSHYTNLGSVSAACIKKAGGNIYGIDCSNLSDKECFFQIYNSIDVPKEGDMPTLSLRILPGTDRSIGENVLGSGGLHLPTGITFAFSNKIETYSPASEYKNLVNIMYF